MHRRLAISFGFALVAVSPAAAERRCGWIENPTPANWWLTDSKGEWIMSTQGGSQAKGMDDLPDLSTHDFVQTNGYYGYACGCLDGTFDLHNKSVSVITSVKQLPLSSCRRPESSEALSAAGPASARVKRDPTPDAISRHARTARRAS